MKNKSLYSIGLILCASVVNFLAGQTIHRDVQRTTEKEVKIKITSSFGSVNISRGDPSKIVEVYYKQREKDEEPRLDLDYTLRKNAGMLELDLHPKGTTVTASDNGRHGSHDVHVNVDNFDFKTAEWYVKLVDDVPLSIDAELGAGKSDFDFTGMNINDLSISTGASSSKVRFDKMNENEIEDFKIETGVSKFSAENLNNANFRHLSFDGGVGSYYLDFGGSLNRTVDVDVNVGLGALTLMIPRNIGVRVKYEESWLSNFSIDDEFVRRKKGVYESENYSDADGRMNISVESGLGSIKIRRSK
jgi:hypothetical protein